jgi:hypothetical protein
MVVTWVAWCRQMEYQEVLLKLQGFFASEGTYTGLPRSA